MCSGATYLEPLYAVAEVCGRNGLKDITNYETAGEFSVHQRRLYYRVLDLPTQLLRI